MSYQYVFVMKDLRKVFPGGKEIIKGAYLSFFPGAKIGVVGLNGAGKSTLLKLMAGLDKEFDGECWAADGASVGYLSQEPQLDDSKTVGENIMEGLGSLKTMVDRFNEVSARFMEEMTDDEMNDLLAEQAELQDQIDAADAWDLDRKIEVASEALRCPPSDSPVTNLSGGERRRVALARLLLSAPDLLLLDEPTNHLDIQAISWLENELKSTRAAYVLISHDRAFLNVLTRATLWIDRGQVRRNEEGFSKFEAWRDKVWDEEDIQRHKMDRKIKSEGRWAVEGISARRKRNQGRLRALKDLRAERASMIKREGTAAMELAAAPKSGRKVIEATGISKSFGGKTILKPFSIKIQRGDRIAFVGPNGVGKTTVLNMLMGKEAPDTGTVQHGTNLLPALFDQTRAQLDPDMTLWESLVGDPEMRVSGKADQVLVRGQPKHVVGYLKEFLFDEAQARAPIRSLSGGEKARVLLAKIMARESNLLVLDEPTNDLDVETLDLLQELLDDYDGTVILVSHDRDFLDRVATTTVAMEGDGRATVYAGGWSDYQSQKPKEDTAKPEGKRAQSGEKSAPKPQPKKKEAGLSYTEKHRLEKLPAIIERLEAEIAKLEEFMSDPDLYSKEPVKWQKATEALVERQTALAEAEEEWLVLEEKASAD